MNNPIPSPACDNYNTGLCTCGKCPKLSVTYPVSQKGRTFACSKHGCSDVPCKCLCDRNLKSFDQMTLESFSETISRPVDEPDFDGASYDPTKDQKRLTGQLLRVFEAMRDCQWHDVASLCDLAQVSPLSITARIRDLRKPKFGSYTIERKRGNDKGLFLYRLQ